MPYQIWAPLNGAPLAEVGRHRGWTVYELPGATVAIAPRKTYVEGSLGEAALEAAHVLGLAL